MCASLAYLSLEHIDEGWLIIQENSPHNEKLQKFYDYFVEQWLENGEITRAMWNCKESRHRTTNNTAEGWNFKLNEIIKRPHPNFYALIRALKEEAKSNDFLYDRQHLKLEEKQRKRKYIKLDERISKILQEYNQSSDIKKCLHALSYVHKLE
jgi:hypothetical protein